MIEQPIIVRSGATVSFHVVNELSSNYPLTDLIVKVNSYASEAAFNAKADADVVWQHIVKIPVVELEADELLPSIELWLTMSPTSPLVGGIIAPDKSETLESVQARQWAAIKASRAKAKIGNFEFDGGVYYADATEVPNSALKAFICKSLGAPYSETWTLTDNTTRVLDADQTIALGMAYGSYISNVYATARELRSRIFADEATIESVMLVTWPSATAVQNV